MSIDVRFVRMGKKMRRANLEIGRGPFKEPRVAARIYLAGDRSPGTLILVCYYTPP